MNAHHGRTAAVFAILTAACALLATGREGRCADVPPDRSSHKVLPSDDWTFRPTVMVRRGTSQGTGTIIASVRGETLILTAGHVVRTQGPIIIELHRYNLGVERRHSKRKGPADNSGRGNPARNAREDVGWPRRVGAVVAAADPAADLAILRIERMVALPYVARLAKDEPAVRSKVTSIGIDLGRALSSWDSVLVANRRFELEGAGEKRLFLITAKPPEHGRSGGGLFLETGELAGVCIGHAALVRDQPPLGIFASTESIRRLLELGHLTDVMALSQRRQAARHTASNHMAKRPSP